MATPDCHLLELVGDTKEGRAMAHLVKDAGVGKALVPAALYRLSRAGLLAVGFAAALLLSACGRPITPQPPAATLTPEPLDVTLVIGTPLPIPTPFECIDIPGLSLSARVLRSGLIEIRGEGFLPGEDTTLIARARVRFGNRSSASTLENHPAAEIGADGRFLCEVGLQSLEGFQTTWHIAVIHSRGVACTTVVVR